MLSTEQIEDFWRDGYLVVADAVSSAELGALRAQISEWVEDSRAHTEPYGAPCLDGKARFDMGAEHTADSPALRRINNPSEISPTFEAVMRQAAMVDMVSCLVGPNLKFHHCKVNLKLPGSHTEVGYHQDFAYTPHTNCDVVTALLMLDDTTVENGCLTVVPGTHRGPVYSLFDEDQFTGTIAPHESATLREAEVNIEGSAGGVCLMHTRLVHGSQANRADRPRGLYICVYTAADAFPLARNPMPNRFEGDILRGRPSRVARLSESHVELPEQPILASFFAVQGQASAEQAGVS